MKKTASFLIGASLLASAAVLPLAAMAQTGRATMPTLYNQSGAAMNVGNAKLGPGYFYLDPNGQRQVYYYGNGTFYDPSTGTYGGSVNNPTGMAGADLGYANSTAIASVPGVPNTGAGGDASTNWALLAASGLVVLGGAAFVSYSLSGKRTA